MEVPAAGARVVVPLGARTVTGIAVDEDAAAAPEAGPKALKPIKRALDSEAFIPPDVLALARWTADYYAAGPGEALTAVLPPKTRGERPDAHKIVRIATISPSGREALTGTSLTTRQREALAVLAGLPHGAPAPLLAARGVGPDLRARLQRRGFIDLRDERLDRDPSPSAALPPPPETARELTGEQTAALSHLGALLDAGVFRVALLHGVTGSGKTEIYLRLAAAAQRSRRRVLMLVPEIALTPAVAGLCRQLFGERVAIQHSGLAEGERHDQWQRIRRGEVDVVVGTRSAVFAPIDRLGLVIVDEEHDASYKQEEGPRYNGRDVAIVRAQRADALVVLGSATPSMETYHNAMTGRYERIVLERRVLDRPLADVSIVDMRAEFAAEGPDVVLSRALRDAIGARLERGEQALVLLNRRGYATSVFCRQCAGSLECPNCSVSLVIHGAGVSRQARCHYCNHAVRVPPACPACAAPYLEQMGFGTERVEADVKRAFEGVRVARLDRDSVRHKGALAATLSRFRDGALDVLVGTQMIAKGHDFPRVTLVGVISADVGLGVADFRASERTFQLLTQVAGRAGRGDQAGEAIVQTLYPGHYSIQLACRQDYPAFYERELRFRRSMRYPPAVALINAVVNSRTFSGAMGDAARLVAGVRQRDSRGELQVLGPAPAPLGRLRGQHRAQFLVKGMNRTRMRELVLAALAERPELQRRTVIDVDPVNML
jgi:primosomal protein N' (replication factor Y)